SGATFRNPSAARRRRTERTAAAAICRVRDPCGRARPFRDWSPVRRRAAPDRPARGARTGIRGSRQGAASAAARAGAWLSIESSLPTALALGLASVVTRKAKGRPEPSALTLPEQSIVRAQRAKLCSVHRKSISLKLNDASGITYTPDSFLLCADS